EYPGFPIGYPSTKDPDPLAVQIGSNLPLMFLGPNAPMSMNISNPDIFKGWPIGINDPATNDARGKELDYIRTVARQSKTYADNLVTAYIAGTNSANYPADNYLAEELKAVARLIKGGLKTRMYLVQISGFDTHADQVVTGSPTTGAHSNLLKLLSDAVIAFQRDLEGLKIDQRVLTMTFSEFGRRIMSNGSIGTDHGVAAPMFVIGTNVQGGIIGKNPDIPADIKVDDNVAMQFDFRSVYSSILKDWFCVSDTSSRKILFNNFQSLPIVKRNCSTIGIEEYQTIEDSVQLNISPNPMTSQCNIQIKVPKGFAQLNLIDPLGRFVKRIFQGKLEEGDHQFKLENDNYPPGNYYVHLQLINIQKTEPLIIVL
ncbi:MAG: DUF1501 domain-containing protein, partial [Saprospiraceae bacterium]